MLYPMALGCVCAVPFSKSFPKCSCGFVMFDFLLASLKNKKRIRFFSSKTSGDTGA